MDRARFERIRSTYAHLEPCGAALVARVFAGAAARDPRLAALADRTDPGAFNARVWNSFSRLVAKVGEFRTLEAPLMALGVHAARNGVGPIQLRILREELLGAMGELLDADWTPRVRRDWAFVLAAVTGAMLRGSLQDAAVSLAA